MFSAWKGLAGESVTRSNSDLSAQQNPLVLAFGDGEMLLSHSVLFVFSSEAERLHSGRQQMECTMADPHL